MKRSILVAPSLLALMLVLSACGGLSEAEQHNSAGVELAEQGQLNEAIAEFGEALRLDPQYTKAYYYRGLAYQHLGRVHQAIQDYGDALRLDAQYVPAYINRGNNYSDLGQYEQAIQDYDEAIRLNPPACPGLQQPELLLHQPRPIPASHSRLGRVHQPDPWACH